jgi:biopolymer transport protein ExbB
MNFNLLHEIVLVIMVALLAIAVGVIIERFIYFGYIERNRKLLADLVSKSDKAGLQAAAKSSSSPFGQLLAGVISMQGGDKDALDNNVQALYLTQQAGIKRLLWLIDTTITLSPLLGLLGTILGIIDTFNALASQGVSDPQAVSRGIGTALFATAAGIGIAAFCLVFHNYFMERVERVNEQLKVLALRQAAAGATEIARNEQPKLKSLEQAAA